MKQVKSMQHKTLDMMDGFRLFWGIMFGVFSLILVMSVPAIILLIIMAFQGAI